MNKVGLTILGDAGDITPALDLGAHTYLLIHDGAQSYEYARQIKVRYPAAKVLIRRAGGIGDSPDSVAKQIAQWFPVYATLGVADWIPWNELDRPEEGGFSVEKVASFGTAFLAEVRQRCPGIRIHWPAFTHESAYQDADQFIWLPVAKQYNCLDLHAYGPGYVERYLEWAAARLPGQSVYVTEFNYGLGDGLPQGRTDYPALLADAFATAGRFPDCKAVVVFTWNWPGAEPGGEALEVRNDPGAQAAIKAAAQAIQSLQPIPADWLARNQPQNTPEERPMTPIAKSAMLHQFNHIAEQTVPEIAATLRLGGISTIKIKTHDGAALMGNITNQNGEPIDPSPLAFRSINDVHNLYQEFAGLGLDFVPWCVPTGQNLDAEVSLAIQVGQACGGHLEVDLEQGQGFWTGDYAEIPTYFQRIFEAGIILDCCIDARPNSTLPWPEIAGYVRRWLSQSYWPDFQLPAADVVKDAVAFLRPLTGDTGQIGVVLPATAETELYPAAELAESLGAVEVSLWAMDTATPGTYAAFQHIPTLVDVPAVVPAPLTRQEALDELWRIADQVLPAKAPETLPECETIKRMLAALTTAA